MRVNIRFLEVGAFESTLATSVAITRSLRVLGWPSEIPIFFSRFLNIFVQQKQCSYLCHCVNIHNRDLLILGNNVRFSKLPECMSSM